MYTADKQAVYYTTPYEKSNTAYTHCLDKLFLTALQLQISLLLHSILNNPARNTPHTFNKL